jgi:hypothetical protein
MDHIKPLAPAMLEEQAKVIFDVSMLPEEYFARFIHTIGSSSFDNYSYRDKTLEKWIYDFHEIATTRFSEIDELREKYLTQEEINEIERREKEEF